MDVQEKAKEFEVELRGTILNNMIAHQNHLP